MSGESTAHPGYTRHELPAFVDAERCVSVRPVSLGLARIRCQLIVHDDDQHVAMVAFDAFAKRGNVAEYAIWGNPWTKVEPGQGPLAWSPSFPRVETPELDKREV